MVLLTDVRISLGGFLFLLGLDPFGHRVCCLPSMIMQHSLYMISDVYILLLYSIITRVVVSESRSSTFLGGVGAKVIFIVLMKSESELESFFSFVGVGVGNRSCFCRCAGVRVGVGVAIVFCESDSALGQIKLTRSLQLVKCTKFIHKHAL